MLRVFISCDIYVQAGSATLAQCTPMCLPGTYSTSGDEFSVAPCRLCSTGLTSVSMGARSLQDCLPLSELLRIPFKNEQTGNTGISPYGWPVPSKGLARVNPDVPEVGIVATLKWGNSSLASFSNGIAVQINGLFCRVIQTSVINGYASVLFVPPEWSDEIASGRIPSSVKLADFTGPSVLEIFNSQFQYEIARSSTLFVLYDSDIVRTSTQISPGVAPSGYTCKPRIRIVLPQSMYVRAYSRSTVCQFFFDGDPSWRGAGVVGTTSRPPFDNQNIVQRSAMLCLGFDGLPIDKGTSVSLRISIDQLFFINLKSQFVRVGVNNLSFAYPQSGSTEGGTMITILGSGFRPYLSNSNNPLCKFSSSPIKGFTAAGRVVSDSSMLCVSPSARAPYPALQLAAYPLTFVATKLTVSLDGSGSFCLEPCISPMLGQAPCSDEIPQVFSYAAPPTATPFLQWVHCSTVVNGCPRPLAMERLGYVGCFFESGQVVQGLANLTAFSKYVCIRAMPSSGVRCAFRYFAALFTIIVFARLCICHFVVTARTHF